MGLKVTPPRSSAEEVCEVAREREPEREVGEEREAEEAEAEEVPKV
jgi:hypothetical protein